MKRPLAAMLSCAGLRLTDTEKKIFSSCNPLGLTLFGRNISNKGQLKTLIAEIKDAIGRDDVLIAIDQEGGRVRRLKDQGFISYASQYAIGSLPLDQAKQAAALHAELISSDLIELGINVNYAPVLDISYPQTTEALKSRCFSDNSDTVAVLGQIMTDTYIANGIIPCIKHMPGHGLAKSDPHLNLPVVDISVQRLQAEIYPFCRCANAPMGMTAHILLPQIDPRFPATQSQLIINDIIRKTIGFNGLLISDAIDMHALDGDIVSKATQSLSAGCDCVCYCMGNTDDLQALARYCPQLSDISLQRLDKALQILHNKHQLNNKKEKIAAYASLIGQTTPYREDYDATEVLHQL